jgi:hypothetical protein
MLNNKNPELGVRADLGGTTPTSCMRGDGAAEGHLIDTSTGEIPGT